MVSHNHFLILCPFFSYFMCIYKIEKNEIRIVVSAKDDTTVHIMTDLGKNIAL